ncbi:MAG: hypothetical protein GZ089_04325 [Aromatoleum sp.]|nr:hypothetical protein [Aromatoleum sp.]
MIPVIAVAASGAIAVIPCFASSFAAEVLRPRMAVFAAPWSIWPIVPKMPADPRVALTAAGRAA